MLLQCVAINMYVSSRASWHVHYGMLAWGMMRQTVTNFWYFWYYDLFLETRRIAAETRATRHARRDAGGVEVAAAITVNMSEGGASGKGGDESESDSSSNSSS
jgi:hypothetical protein